LKLFTGTSGYSYKEWKGKFYPADIPSAKMLNFYSEHFNTVEINNTFYRMPKIEVLEKWRNEVPEDFKFIIKAPKLITHIKKLEPDDSTDYFIKTVSSMGDHLGVILFQLPPYAKKDINKLISFTGFLPDGLKAAFEFRNISWFDDEVYDCLRKKNFALCQADTDETPVDGIISTADWGYLRLRKLNYNATELKNWGKAVSSGSWNEAYVIFKHEDEAKGPEYARNFMQLAKV
jgi:uncharacterized protein YecE (DUF72 family)